MRRVAFLSFRIDSAFNFNDVTKKVDYRHLPLYLAIYAWKGKHARAPTTDTQWRHKSKKSENLGQCGTQNMLRPYLRIWEWELIFVRAVKAISSPGVRSLCFRRWRFLLTNNMAVVKIESVPKIIIFGIKLMVKSDLKFILKLFNFPLLHKKKNVCQNLQI